MPSGVATDDVSKNLFGFLIKNGRLVSLFDFENREGLFVGVHRSYKFCLLTLRGRNDPEAAQLAFFLHKSEDLQDEDRRFSLTADEFNLLSPITGLCPTFRSKRDKEVVLAIYRRVKPLIKQQTEKSDWVQGDFLIMFRSDDSDHLYRTAAELAVTEASPTSLPRLQAKEAVYVPVRESKLIHQFDHRFASFAGVDETERNKGNCRELNSAEKQEAWIALPRHWAPLDAVNDSLSSRRWRRSWTLGYRDITNATNERTAIASCLPEGGAAQPLNLFLPESPLHGILWLACMNSMVLDYVARQRIGGVHLNITTCRQLPVVGPAGVPADIGQFVRDRVLELAFTSPALVPFAQDCGWSGPPFRWDDERRFLLRCELDAAFFHLYLPDVTNGDWRPAEGETKEELARLKTRFATPRDAAAYIMDTFPIVRRKDEEKYDGDYRTRRIILDIYDAMSESIRTGKPYQTSLDPSPADLRCCHPSKQIGILAFGSLLQDPGPELKPRIVMRLETQTPFPVEYARISGKTRGGAPTLVPHEAGSPVYAEILVLDDEVPVEEARNILWRRETRKTSGEKYSEGASPNSVLVRTIDSPTVSTVLYTDFRAEGKIGNPTPGDLAKRAIESVGKADEGMDGISYLINAIARGIQTPLTQSYCNEILRQTKTDSLADALVKAKTQYFPRENAVI